MKFVSLAENIINMIKETGYAVVNNHAVCLFDCLFMLVTFAFGL